MHQTTPLLFKLKGNTMYEDDLPLTGMGVISVGGAVFQSWQVAAIGFGIVVVGLIITRVARPKKALNI